MSTKRTKSKKKSRKNETEDRFKILDPHEHILKRPDMYLGSIKPDRLDTWVCNKKNVLVYKSIKYVPGFYKIFDEILVNARDQTIRDKTCKKIKITINQKEGIISCYNNDYKEAKQIHKHKE